MPSNPRLSPAAGDSRESTEPRNALATSYEHTSGVRHALISATDFITHAARRLGPPSGNDQQLPTQVVLLG